MECHAYIDGHVVPVEQATVPFIDRGNLFGDGVFETLRAIDGNVLFLDRHETRLRHGLHVLGIDAHVVEGYHAACQALLDAVDERHVYLRINISHGDMQGIVEGGTPRITGLGRPSHPYPLAGGVRLVTSGIRLQRDSPLAGVKSLSFLPYLMARRQAVAAGADDALLFNDAGRIAECSTSNIMAHHDGVLYAPGIEEGALGGVTRDVVLECAQAAGLQVEDRLEPEVLAVADEVWATNTSGGLVPVLSIDGRSIPGGKLIDRLRTAYEATWP